MTRLALRLLFVLALASGLSACDSGDGGGSSPEDVAGVYTASEFRFVPSASALSPVNVRDTLSVDQSSLEILDGGQVLFRYRLQGGTSQLLLGEASVRSQQVRITFDAGTAAQRQRLLLPNQVTFDRDGSTLTSDTQTTVNLESYSPRYSGGLFSEVPGRLVLTLAPQQN